MSNEVQCPYCETYQEIEDLHEYSEHDNHEHQCKECDRNFVFHFAWDSVANFSTMTLDCEKGAHSLERGSGKHAHKVFCKYDCMICIDYNPAVHGDIEPGEPVKEQGVEDGK